MYMKNTAVSVVLSLNQQHTLCLCKLSLCISWSYALPFPFLSSLASSLRPYLMTQNWAVFGLVRESRSFEKPEVACCVHQKCSNKKLFTKYVVRFPIQHVSKFDHVYSYEQLFVCKVSTLL